MLLMTQSTAAAPTIETFGEEAIEKEHRSIESLQIVSTLRDKEQVEQEYVTFEVTAYTAGPESTGKHPGHPAYGITASGAVVQQNLTAACGPEHEFGTRIYIPHFNNTFECQDRGGLITEGKLDVYMERVEDARQFGRRNLEALIVR